MSVSDCRRAMSSKSDVVKLSKESVEEEIASAEARLRGHGKILGKLRLNRGPLRWWLLVVGLVTIQYVAWRFALGLGLVIAGAVLHVISKGYLLPGLKFLNRQTKALTTRGPYRFTRNPFYLANLFAELGLLLIIGRVWIAVIYLPIWAWVYCETILLEERKLLALCGDVYRRYCSQVPQLFPRPWRFLRDADLSGARFSWKNPHIAKGNEIQRALRLVSYPYLLRSVAAAMVVPNWWAVMSNPIVISFGASFLMLNAMGWLITHTLRGLNRSTRLRTAGDCHRTRGPSLGKRRLAA